MTKVNQQTMKTQYDGQYDTFCRKNHDYGNSFEESLDQFGIVASIVRMSDKMKRLASLTDESKTQQVGSESLLDTLEDLSNYAAMTACWLKGVREEDGENTIYADNKMVVTFTEDDTEYGPDMIDVITYNVEDVKNVMSRSAEMEKEFNKYIPSKVENIDPRNYVINILSNIFRVVRMKIEKDEMLVPMDISDEAGLIAKAIVESQTEEEGGAVINNYMCKCKDIPYELKDWVYGIIMHYFYYLKKERDEVVSLLKQVKKFHYKIEEFDMTEEDHKELEEIVNRLRSIIEDVPISKQCMVDLIHTHVKLNPDVLIFQLYNQVRELFNSEFLEKAKSILNDLFENIILCRDQNIPLPKRLAYCSERETKYDDLATLVLEGHINFSELAGIMNDYPNLRVVEKNHLLQSIVSSAYKISDEPDDEKPEFLNKKFHIPDEILEDLKETEEEPERKRTVLGMIFPFRL